KYDLIGISNADWREHAEPCRDRDREAELLSIIPEVRVDRQFSVANRYFGSELKMKAPGVPKCDVEMRPLNGYSLFDWLGVLEMADEIHTVSTSLIYLLESMNFM